MDREELTEGAYVRVIEGPREGEEGFILTALNDEDSYELGDEGSYEVSFPNKKGDKRFHWFYPEQLEVAEGLAELKNL